MLAVNAELIRLYWEIGQMLDARQKTEGWGAAVIPKLALDIRNELPEEKGFSERNSKRMLAFYRKYRAVEWVPQALRMPENVQQKTIAPLIAQFIAPGTQVDTDEYDIYARLPEWGYGHKMVCHGRGEYARERGKRLLEPMLCTLLTGTG